MGMLCYPLNSQIQSHLKRDNRFQQSKQQKAKPNASKDKKWRLSIFAERGGGIQKEAIQFLLENSPITHRNIPNITRLQNSHHQNT